MAIKNYKPTTPGRRGMSTLSNEEITTNKPEKSLLEVKNKKDSFEVISPEWRTDIHIKEDIIEEVGRLLGYDNITPTVPRHVTAEKNKMFELKTMIRNTMSSFGANELLTYSFVSERLLKKVTKR